MKDINDLVCPVTVPGDVAVALSTGRSSLVPSRALTPDESVQVLALVRCLMDTNSALQDRLRLTELSVTQLADLLNGAHGKAMLTLDLIDGGSRGGDE